MKTKIFFLISAAVLFGGVCFGDALLTISDVKFDSKTYFPMDIISSTPAIEMVLSLEDGAAGSIEISADSKAIYSGPVTGGVFSFTFPGGKKISPGVHTICVKVADSAGRVATKSFSDLRVLEEGVKLSGLTCYPQSFSPGAGEKTTVSYILSVDGDLTILIYSGAGDLVWERDIESGAPGGKRGYNVVCWDGRNKSEKIVGNGCYPIKIISGNRVAGSAKVLVMD